MRASDDARIRKQGSMLGGSWVVIRGSFKGPFKGI